MVALTHFLFGLSAVTGTLASPVALPDADLPDFDFASGLPSLAARQDYNQDYKGDGANITYTPRSEGYLATFYHSGNFVVGKGWSTGSLDRNIQFKGNSNFKKDTALITVYGWSRNPLIEYYIQEYSSNNEGVAKGTKLGSFETDGSIYDIWKSTRVDKPSIDGTATFDQYISSRRTPRVKKGTITFRNHTDAWAALNLTLGTLNYQVFATEGWSKATGWSNYSVTATSSAPATTTTTSGWGGWGWGKWIKN